MSSTSDTIRRASSILLRKLGSGFHYTASLIYQSESRPSKAIVQWFADSGDKTLRLFYSDLCQDSLVFDVGGYEGQWASDIYSMYRCNIYIFEPVPEFADAIKRRFIANPDIEVYQVGFAQHSKKVQLNVNGDRSSILRQGRHVVECEFIRADDFLREHDIQLIDLMKINIEGAEYELLEHLLETGWIHKIRNIQVQFHDFLPGAKERMNRIQSELSKSHTLTYQYEFVWENWALREPTNKDR
jgi:FkbM family methyltransferase